MGRRNKLLYVAGAYRADSPWGVRNNVMAAAAVSRTLWIHGYTAHCPHLNNWDLDGPELPSDAILQGDFEIIRRCDGIVVCPGWGNSSGTRQEIVLGLRLGKPVLFFPRDPAEVSIFLTNLDEVMYERSGTEAEVGPTDDPTPPVTGGPAGVDPTSLSSWSRPDVV